MAAATLLALVLRIAAAGGDLGLDEVWSLRLVGTVHSLGGVFWGISHDNNHVLNSAWLYLVGPDRTVWLYRLPAIVLGTLTVPAVARWLGRYDPTIGCFGALLAAVAFPLVDFGSEARGYAGLTLATVLVFDEAGRATNGALDRQDRGWGSRWRLGIAIGLGLFCHFAMLDTVAVAGLAALIDTALRTRSVTRTITILARVFWPGGLLALFALATFAAGVLIRGEFKIGDAVPFGWGILVEGLSGMLLLISGLPDTLPGAVGLVLALLIVAGAIRYDLVSRRILLLALAALVVFPAAVALARLPNVGYARYFAVSGIVLLAIQSEMLGRLWARSPEGRRAVALAALLPILGGLMLDANAIRVNRGGFSETLRLMRAEGSPSYATDRPVMADMLLGDAAARRRETAPAAVAAGRVCTDKPDWYIAIGVYDPRPEGTVRLGGDACTLTYRARQPFPASPLSGTQWTLYRRH